MLVGPPFTQGPKGWYGSSGSQGSKTLERRRNTETEEEKQRWEEMGCKASRHGRSIFKNQRRNHKVEWRMSDLHSPSSEMKKLKEVEQMKG